MERILIYQEGLLHLETSSVQARIVKTVGYCAALRSTNRLYMHVTLV